MTTVFIAGSISISRLHEKVLERIGKIVSSDYAVVVGDADGADTSIQECLLNYQARNVTVYCTGDTPRNNVANWPVHQVKSKARPGTRAFYTAKDLEMARNSDFGLMVWDCKSTGTLSNIIELMKNGKKSVVFVNKNKDFINVSNQDTFETLLSFMSAHARNKAEEKIALSEKISALGQDSFLLDLPKIPETRRFEFPEIEKSLGTDVIDKESVRLCTVLMTVLDNYIVQNNLSQSEAAKALGVTQLRISELLQGKLDLFSLDNLVDMASSAGFSVDIKLNSR